MSDRYMGGLLAFVVAAPIMIVCCGGGGILLAAIIGGVGGWLTGLSGIATVVAILGAFLLVRQIRHYQVSLNTGKNADASCCPSLGGRATVHDSGR